eukprot:Mycagemm_TRINITY_DN8924_c0_g2::TRINITY_DN8924_c0_g2_i1::g.5588::m.5588 type:complete len:107 gc:universal TRINITY_DN8924_c0_g2_i1:72-392(+)
MYARTSLTWPEILCTEPTATVARGSFTRVKSAMRPPRRRSWPFALTLFAFVEKYSPIGSRYTTGSTMGHRERMALPCRPRKLCVPCVSSCSACVPFVSSTNSTAHA